MSMMNSGLPLALLPSPKWNWKLKTQLGVHPSCIQTTAPVGFLEAKPIQENPGHHSLSSRAILWGRTLHLGWRKRFGSSTDSAIVRFLLRTTWEVDWIEHVFSFVMWWVFYGCSLICWSSFDSLVVTWADLTHVETLEMVNYFCMDVGFVSARDMNDMPSNQNHQVWIAFEHAEVCPKKTPQKVLDMLYIVRFDLKLRRAANSLEWIHVISCDFKAFHVISYPGGQRRTWG